MLGSFVKLFILVNLLGNRINTHLCLPWFPIPVMEEPFSQIIVDCVGPLPKTRAGNQYLLNIMCASTRFPEAIRLCTIKVEKIAKALVKFFTFVGLPKVVQSDQGSRAVWCSWVFSKLGVPLTTHKVRGLWKGFIKP